MKKFAFGVMLLAAALTVVGCKSKDKDDDAAKTLEDFSLSKTELKLKAGENATLTASTGSSIQGSFKWHSSDESIVTVIATTTGKAVMSRANVTAVSLGTATITCTEEKSGIVKECAVSVVNELGAIEFDKTYLGIPLDENKNVTIVDDTPVPAYITNTNCTIQCVLVKADMRIFSKDFYYSNEDGTLSGLEEGYILELPAYAPYATFELNPEVTWRDQSGNVQQYFKDEDGYRYNYWSTGYWHTENTPDYFTMEAGKVNEEAYLTHIKSALNIFNETLKANASSFPDTYYEELHNAAKEITGAQLTKWSYSEGGYSYNILPVAIAIDARVNAEYDSEYKYMDNINGQNITIRPFGGTNLYELMGWDGEFYLGVNLKIDDENNVVVAEDKVVYQDDINYFEPVVESAPLRKFMLPQVSLEEMKMMQNRNKYISVNKEAFRK